MSESRLLKMKTMESFTPRHKHVQHCTPHTSVKKIVKVVNDIFHEDRDGIFYRAPSIVSLNL
jgi:hypothetical protein